MKYLIAALLVFTATQFARAEDREVRDKIIHYQCKVKKKCLKYKHKACVKTEVITLKNKCRVIIIESEEIAYIPSEAMKDNIAALDKLIEGMK